MASLSRTNKTSRQRRRVGSTLVLAAATGGLLAAALAAAPIACADDAFADIASDVQGSITYAEGDFTNAATDFATAGDTNAGLVAEFEGLDNLLISPGDYTLAGLTAAATETDFSPYAGYFYVDDADLSQVGQPLTAAGEQAVATADLGDAQTFFSEAASFLSGGDLTDAAVYGSLATYEDIVASQAETLAALFTAGI